MAVDWINRNLYWSDSYTSRFEVATLDGKYRRSFYIERLSKPRGMKLSRDESLVISWAELVCVLDCENETRFYIWKQITDSSISRWPLELIGHSEIWIPVS